MRRQGFTLLEILIVMTITAMASALLYNALLTSIQAVKTVNRAFETPRQALILSRMLHRELSGILLPGYLDPPKPKEGEKLPPMPSKKMEYGLIGQEKEIHFTTLLPMTEEQMEETGDVMEIGYAWDVKTKSMQKRVDPFVDEELDDGGEEIDLPMRLESVEFEFFDTKWRDKWDSTKSNTLPRAIRLTVEIGMQEDVEEDLGMEHQILVLLVHSNENKNRF